MRSRKELIYLNIKDLTKEEIAELGNLGLSCCDNCGEIEQSEKLHWIDGEDYWDDEYCKNLVASGMCSICGDCHEKREKYFAQCGSCDNYFIAHKDFDTDCSHCSSGNWIYGCIDEPENGEQDGN